MENFTDILDQPLTEEVERPKPMPVGTYQWVIPSPHTTGTSRAKGTPFVELLATCQGALDDVDSDALEEFGNPAGKQQRVQFYPQADAPNPWWRLDAFLREVLGIPAGSTRSQALAEAVGQSFAGRIRHEPSQDGTQIFARIDTNSLAAL